MPDQPVTFGMMRDCARRELSYRKRVYPRWVAAGKLSQVDADTELRRMKAIADYFTDLLQQQPGAQLGLLPGDTGLGEMRDPVSGEPYCEGGES